jgi:hypothetical protein
LARRSIPVFHREITPFRTETGLERTRAEVVRRSGAAGWEASRVEARVPIGRAG